ncbi:DUF4102 domain-containing protein [Salmonella enterica]|uniref:DUF4102 domain-containing protein n=1 Tax=Salmonella enterica TaxID=28901 RepID=A0A5T3GKF7_SALER|nr:DUF4102 domain-containing protein [Salmonella enterica]EBE7704548.1 DUF4102 domain-containing protein [Salmonella enterica]EBG3365780.1 DUF4102 domain-containing protein [Salmonella enterica]ECP2758506.1 DUF4102 domain-containing protein [Salmonella enterica]
MVLTDLAIRHARPLSKAYRLSDCHGLYLQVNPSGSKLWYLKFRFGNKENRMALGPYPLISLVLAREKQADIRRLILEGINPAEKRREDKRGGEPLYTFESVAREWVSSNINWSAEHSTALFSELTGFNIALNAVQSGSRASGASCAADNPLLLQL